MANKVFVNEEFPRVQINETEIFFTPMEFKIFVFLWRHKNLTCTRPMLLEATHHWNANVETRVIDVYIGYVRKKLRNTFLYNAIIDLRGFGYRFVYSEDTLSPVFCECTCKYCNECIGKDPENLTL